MPYNIAKGAQISPEREEIIPKLVELYSSLVRATHQYSVASLVVTGNEATAVSADLEEHSVDDSGQAYSVLKRIYQLGEGTKVLFNELDGLATGEYQNPEDDSTLNVLKQTLKTIRGAVELLNSISILADESKDYVTLKLISKILSHEVEHETAVRDMIADLTSGK